MKLTQTLIAVAILSMTPSAFAADALATVNGKPVKQSLYDVIVKDVTANGQKIDANTKAAIIDELVSSELVYQEAQKLGLDKQPDFQAREELGSRKLLTSVFYKTT